VSSNDPEAYEVTLSETAEADIDSIVFRMMGLSSDLARRWQGGLIDAMNSLTLFPHRHPLAPETSLYGRQVRAFVYGRGHSAYRVLYAITEANAGHSPTVRIVRVVHGSRGPADHNDES
jgi:plasmid stabilization system protein ParE